MIWILSIVAFLLISMLAICFGMCIVSSRLTRFEEAQEKKLQEFRLEFRETDRKYIPRHKKIQIAPWDRIPGFPRAHRAVNVLPHR